LALSFIMATMFVRNTFVEVEEDCSPVKASSRPWSTFNVFGVPPISELETEVESEDEQAASSEETSDSDLDAAKSAVEQQLERIAEENVRLLQENARLRTQQIVVPQWMPMQMQFFVPPVQQPAQTESKSSRRRRQRAKGKASALEHEGAGAQNDTPPTQTETRTTVMLRNLPREYSRDMLLEMLDECGFCGKYDFVYMPIDFVRKASLGYAFINLVSVEVVMEFWNTFDGYENWKIESAKTCRVSWSDPHQGLEEHVNRYRNSPLMHEDVPDDVRPVLFQGGVRIAFPAPTKSLRAPRLRASRQRNPFWSQEAEGSVSMMQTFDVYA
jgi:hypothetical protein